MPEIVTFPDVLDPDLIEAARAQLSVCERRMPEVAALATVASLARSIEPELLRALRVGLGSRIFERRISVSAESALWFSNFVESRGADAITLLPESLRVLRPRLAINLELLEHARAIVADCHRSAPEVLQWEERIVYLALTGKTSLMEDEVMRGLRSISSGTRRPLVNWISDMWLRLPPEASSNLLIGKLHQVASGLTRRRTRGQPGQESSAGDLILDFSSFPTRELGVVLKGDRFIIGDLPDAKLGIQVPDLDPVELDVSFGAKDGWDEQTVVRRDETAEINVAWDDLVRLRTLAGRIYELNVNFFRPPKTATSVFISYTHESDKQLERVLALAARLREDGIDATLDRYLNGPPPQGWRSWILGQVKSADFVLVICTESYYRRVRADARRVSFMETDWAGALLTQEHIYSSKRLISKYIPVILSDADVRWIPEKLRSTTYFLITSEKSYESLCKRLTDKSVPIGPPFVYDSNSTVEKFDISRIIKYAPADLIGRDDELKLLNDAWDEAVQGETRRPRVFTFVGLGGEGKTSLVAKWAADLAFQDWPGCDAAFAWSFYSQGTREQTAASSDLFLKEAISFFGDDTDKEFAASNAGAFEKGHRLARIVGRQRSLLILDGLEPLQYAPASPTPGELKDQGICALLKGVAATGHGLCVVTTRYSLPDLRAFWQTTAPEVKLLRLSREAGVHLLKTLGVKGSERRSLLLTPGDENSEKVNEFELLVEDVRGHALTLNLLGGYLRDAHGGDIRKRDLVNLPDADAKEVGGSSFQMYAAYTRWLESEGNEGKRAVAMLRLMGLFDRPATADCVEALLKPPAISGLTELLISLSAAQRNIALTRLEATKLLTTNRDPSGTLITLDAHPLLREYFARQLREQNPDAWRAAHRRLYEHLTSTTADSPEPTLEDLQPLAQAIASGCQAGLYQQVFDEVYLRRLQRNDEAYLWRRLAAFGTDLAAIACFFDQPWARVSSSLSEQVQAFVLHNAAFDLQALGRVVEALEPMRAAVDMRTRQGDWKNAAISAGNLSGLELTLGDVARAVGDAEQSVTYADRSDDVVERMGKRTTHANALHQAGRRIEAETRFREAEQMYAGRQSAFPLLYSLPGFWYCDLLLAAPERAASQMMLELKTQNSILKTSIESCHAVSERAAQTLKWTEMGGQGSLLSTALHHLTMCRAALYEVLLGFTVDGLPFKTQNLELKTSMDVAVNGLRRSGRSDLLPHGLLSRAWLRFLTSAHTGPESVQEDLDEAWEIAERGPMRLFMVDIHLYRARLFGGMKDQGEGMKYPWDKNPDGTPRGPKDDLAAARKLIEQCGYWRRKEELEDAEEAAKNWN
jgi:hypothetical protein